MNGPPEERDPLVFRLLLALHPAAFRERHGEGFLAFLEAQRADPSYQGAVGRMRFWRDVVWDVVRSTVALRREDRGQQGEGRMTGWTTDLRLAVRGLLRSPSFTALVVLTLATGIGATTAIFSVVYDTLLTPLPLPEADRLAVLWQNDRASGTTREPVASADYFDLLESADAFADLAAFSTGTATLTGADEAQRLTTAVVSGNLTTVLGTQPSLGRSFGPDEVVPGAPLTAMLTDRLWRSRFSADPSVLGRTLSLDGEPVTVIGVLPPEAAILPVQSDLWLPMRVTPATAVRIQHIWMVVGRLRDGVSVQMAQGQAESIASDLAERFPVNANRGAYVEPYSHVIRGDVQRTLWVLMGAVALVLFIACTNVANLLLARGAVRQRQIAVMAAVGATAGRLARRFLLEGLVVSALSAALGALLAAAVLGSLLEVLPLPVGLEGDVGLSLPVLGFAIAVSTAAGVGFGLIPSVQLRSLDLLSSLREGTGGEGGRGEKLMLRRGLVAVQVALSVVLLVGSALLGRTLLNLEGVDPGFEVDGVLRVSTFLPPNRYPRDFSVWPDWREVLDFQDELLRQARDIPGVTSVALSVNHPLDPGFTNGFSIENRPSDPEQPELTTRMITQGYDETVGLRVLEGRSFRDTDDRTSAPVALLNRIAADQLFPDGGALGQRIAIWGNLYREVVGIVEDERVRGVKNAAPAALYVNLLQAPPVAVPIVLLAKVDGDPLSVAPEVQRLIRDLDPLLPLFAVTTMEETMKASMARERFVSGVLLAFASSAVLLAILGIHGVLGYVVAQRRREMGIRMALGASRGVVLGLVLGQGGRMTLLGIALGLGASWFLSRGLEGLLFEVSPTEPSVYLVVALLVALTALGASALPARTATRTDPARTLREQ